MRVRYIVISKCANDKVKMCNKLNTALNKVGNKKNMSGYYVAKKKYRIMKLESRYSVWDLRFSRSAVLSGFP